MEILTESAFAKLNLTLDVLNRREDGYHDIRSVEQTISLRDDVVLNVGTGRRWAIFRVFRRAVICPASTVIVIISCVISVPPLRFAPPPRS